MALTGVAQAAVHWTLDSGCVNSGNGPGKSSSTAPGNTCSFTPDSGTVIATGSGWAGTANTGGGVWDDLLEPAIIHEASAGAAGVRWLDGNNDELENSNPPDHSMDNRKGGGFGEMELILFDFGTEDVNIEAVDVAYRTGGSDAMFTVLAFTGTEPGDTDDLNGIKLTTEEQGLTGVGWEFVTTVSDVEARNVTGSDGINDISAASAGIFASKWIVSMHSTGYDGATRQKGGFKIAGLKGDFDEPGTGQNVPLPATALLLLAGALPMLRRRRS